MTKKVLLIVASTLALGLGACSSGGSSLSAPPESTTTTQTPSDQAYADCLNSEKTATECQPLNPTPDSQMTKYLLCLEDKSKTVDDCKPLDPDATNTPTPTPTWTTYTPTPTPVPTLTTPSGQMQNLANGITITVTITNDTTKTVVANYSLTVNSVKYDAPLGSQPDAGYVWVVVTVTVKMHNGGTTIGDKGFSIPTASSGDEIYPDATVGSFPSSEMTAGQSKTGDIGFQVPNGQHGVVQYYSNGKTASWKI